MPDRQPCDTCGYSYRHDLITHEYDGHIYCAEHLTGTFVADALGFSAIIWDRMENGRTNARASRTMLYMYLNHSTVISAEGIAARHAVAQEDLRRFDFMLRIVFDDAPDVPAIYRDYCQRAPYRPQYYGE